jgi:hypothetical protein
MRSRGMPKLSPKKLAEKRIVQEGRDRLLDPMLHVDVHYRGGRLFHHRGEGLLDRNLALGDHALLAKCRRAKARENREHNDHAKFAR